MNHTVTKTAILRDKFNRSLIEKLDLAAHPAPKITKYIPEQGDERFKITKNSILKSKSVKTNEAKLEKITQDANILKYRKQTKLCLAAIWDTEELLNDEFAKDYFTDFIIEPTMQTSETVQSAFELAEIEKQRALERNKINSKQAENFLRSTARRKNKRIKYDKIIEASLKADIEQAVEKAYQEFLKTITKDNDKDKSVGSSTFLRTDYGLSSKSLKMKKKTEKLKNNNIKVKNAKKKLLEQGKDNKQLLDFSDSDSDTNIQKLQLTKKNPKKTIKVETKKRFTEMTERELANLNTSDNEKENKIKIYPFKTLIAKFYPTFLTKLRIDQHIKQRQMAVQKQNRWNFQQEERNQFRGITKNRKALDQTKQMKAKIELQRQLDEAAYVGEMMEYAQNEPVSVPSNSPIKSSGKNIKIRKNTKGPRKTMAKSPKMRFNQTEQSSTISGPAFSCHMDKDPMSLI